MLGFSDMMLGGGGGVQPDPYLSLVDLLIQPTQLDSNIVDKSTSSPKSITNNGTTLTTSIWSGYQGISFANSSQYLLATAALTTGSGAWCYEWIFSSTSSTYTFYSGSGAVNAGGFNTHGALGGSNFQKNIAPAMNIAPFSTSINTTVYYCAVRDAGGNWNFYKDGVRVNTGNNSPGDMGGGSNLYIGRTPDLGNGYFTGTLYALRVTRSDRGYSGTSIPNLITTGPLPTF